MTSLMLAVSFMLNESASHIALIWSSFPLDGSGMIILGKKVRKKAIKFSKVAQTSYFPSFLNSNILD